MLLSLGEVNMLELLNEFTWDIPALIALLGAMILYFGKIIADTKVEHFKRINIYITGLFFTLTLIFLPFVVAYQIFKEITIPLVYFSIPILLIYGLLTTTLYANQYFFKLDIRKKYKNKYEQKMDSIKKSDTKFGKFVDKHHGKYKKKVEYDDGDLIIDSFEVVRKLMKKTYLLFLCSLVLILFLPYAFGTGEQIIIMFSIFVGFFGLTMIAIAHGFKNVHYPDAKITLDSGEEINGRIIKFGTYLFVMDGDMKRFVNRDKVSTVEFSKYKSNDTS